MLLGRALRLSRRAIAIAVGASPHSRPDRQRGEMGVVPVATVCAGEQQRVYGAGFVSSWKACGCSRTADAKLPCDRRATRLVAVLGLEPDDADDLAS